SFFPVPPDVLLIPMVIAHPSRWARRALICTAGSVLGSLLGYTIGWMFYETVGKMIVSTYHLERAVEVIGNKYQQNAFITVFTAAFTPIPYKAITITGGLFKIPLGTLVTASILGRGGRFFLVALSLRLFGKKIADSIEKYFDVFSFVFVGLLVLGFLCLKFLSSK
ncbi:MAG: VTT domain-containing protein, partial [Candidatus Omnitrophica bacterium]|nr:VTT domain-containing protein [Candidatus Omnitrophota bacterium]